MRPLFRRWEPSKLETARQVVSRAERRALERAELLCQEAEDLFKAAEIRSSEAERKAREEVLAAVKDDLASARAQSEQILRRARSEAEELLVNAINTIERNTAASAAVRAQHDFELAAAQQTRFELEKELMMARQDRQEAAICLETAQFDAVEMAQEVEERCQRLVLAARAAAEAEFIAARQELAKEIASMRDAMASTWSTLEGLLTEAEIISPAAASAGQALTPPPRLEGVETVPAIPVVVDDGPALAVPVPFADAPPAYAVAEAEFEGLMDVDIELRVPISAA